MLKTDFSLISIILNLISKKNIHQFHKQCKANYQIANNTVEDMGIINNNLAFNNKTPFNNRIHMVGDKIQAFNHKIVGLEEDFNKILLL